MTAREDPFKILSGSITAQSLKYWEGFLNWLFKYSTRCYQLKNDAPKTLIENTITELEEFSVRYRRFSPNSKGIICKVTKDREDIQLTADILKKLCKSLDKNEFCEVATAEILTKVLAYRELETGCELEIPTMMPDKSMRLVKYRVDDVIDLWSKVKAFGLIPEEDNVAPILIYRGTDFSLLTESGRASLMSDLDPKGPGRTLFSYAKPKIQLWLERASKKGKKARLLGHSLGASFVAYTVIYLSDFISYEPHEISYAFNPPGLIDEMLQAWNEVSDRPPFLAYICRGDLISKFGKLYEGVYELSVDEELSPLTAHELLTFAQPKCYLQEVDVEKENVGDSRKFYCKIQDQTSSVMYQIGLKYLFPSHK